MEYGGHPAPAWTPAVTGSSSLAGEPGPQFIEFCTVLKHVASSLNLYRVFTLRWNLHPIPSSTILVLGVSQKHSCPWKHFSVWRDSTYLLMPLPISPFLTQYLYFLLWCSFQTCLYPIVPPLGDLVKMAPEWNSVLGPESKEFREIRFPRGISLYSLF